MRILREIGMGCGTVELVASSFVRADCGSGFSRECLRVLSIIGMATVVPLSKGCSSEEYTARGHFSGG